MKKGSKKGMTKVITMDIPKELHTDLKMAAAKAGVTLKGFVIKAIADAVEKGGKSKS